MHDLCGDVRAGMGQRYERPAGGKVSLVKHDYVEKRQPGAVPQGHNHTQYEPIWYGWLAGTRLCPLADRKQSDVWEIPRPKVSEEHPTMKPVSLVAKAMLNSSHAGDSALDLFGVSGTTMIAAQQNGRICLMMELDPKYCGRLGRNKPRKPSKPAGQQRNADKESTVG